MEIDKYVQDENGMTALMHAAHHKTLISIVEKLIEDNDDNIHLIDNNGETALFHAVNNIDTLSTLLSSKIDINHQNNNGETVFIYCCKNELMSAVTNIKVKSDPDFNIRDINDRNAIMYLVENGKYKDITFLQKKSKEAFDLNYRNRHNETLVSILISQFRKLYFSENFRMQSNKVLVYSITLMYLIRLGCDFNAPIDEEGNTPIMFFLMIGDTCSAHYILQNYKDIDLSIKNKNGLSASFLSLTVKEPKNYLRKSFLQNKTFDYYYQDEHQNNPLMYYLVTQDSFLFYSACYEINSAHHEKVYNQVNDKNENILIMAAKLGNGKYITDTILSNIDIDHQDHLGNTALYYAIKIKEKYAINALAYHHANIKIKNNQGVSALDLSKEINDNSINKILDNPISPSDFEKKERKKDTKFMFFKKKKNSDEKLENYIQNYQIDNYVNDYDYILKEKEYSYLPFQDYNYMKGSLWMIYSKQGYLQITYDKRSNENRESINDAKIHLKNIIDERNQYNEYSFIYLDSDEFINYQEFKKCPF